MSQKRIVIAGGSGFIGTALAAEFTARGYEVIILTRMPRSRADGVKEVVWNGEHVGEWIQALEGAEAIINLAGRSVNCPHTLANLSEIKSSRVNSVRALAAAFEFVKNPPRAWIQASATGFYGDTREKICDETALSGGDALAVVCHEWEKTFRSVQLPKTRKVILRIGVVLGRTGGVLPILARMTRWFLGGTAGSGRQYISWVHLADMMQMIAAVVTNEKLSGTYNAVAPSAVTNAEFMRELRRVLRRPWCPPAPKFVVRLGARLTKSDPSLALTSQRCVPRRLLDAGFVFQFGQLDAALRDLCGKKSS